MDTKKQLLGILQKASVIVGNVTLASGKTSSFYIDGKMTSLSRDGVVLAAKLFFERLGDAVAVGGPTMGADPFLGAILYEAHAQNKPLKAFIVRKDVKGHGTMKKIEGPVQKGDRVVLIEDVITTGGSVLTAARAVQEAGCTVTKVICLLDRNEGAKEAFTQAGIAYESIFTTDDLDLPNK
jgi:orotate phosphoribosyltransferase